MPAESAPVAPTAGHRTGQAVLASPVEVPDSDRRLWPREVGGR